MKIITIILILFVAFNSNAQRSKLYTGLEMSLISLNAADVITTSYILNNGGVELNPFMKPFADKSLQIIAIKSIAITGSLLINRQLYKDNPKLALVNLIVLNMFYGYVINNNIQVSIGLKIRP